MRVSAVEVDGEVIPYLILARLVELRASQPCNPVAFGRIEVHQPSCAAGVDEDIGAGLSPQRCAVLAGDQDIVPATSGQDV